MKIVAVQHDRKISQGKSVQTLITEFLGIHRIIRRHETKQACFFFISQILELSFTTEKLGYCKTSIIALNDFMGDLNSFPRSHVVQFKYFSGKFRMFEEKYTEAREDLEYAFQHCHKDSIENKLKILELLIPVKLKLGEFPKPRLLQKYSLPHLEKIIQACRDGDIALFQQELEQNQQHFIEKGTFLLVTLLEPLIYRKIVAQTLQVQTKRFEEKIITLEPNKMPLSVLLAALRVKGMPNITTDELECILANLIFKGYLKGYIAHSRAIVLPKKNPFPALNTKKLQVEKWR